MQIYQNKNFRLLAIMAVLVGIVLFPYGWLANNWEFMDRVEEVYFEAEWTHTVGHFVLYSVLGMAVLAIFPKLRTRPLHYFAWIFATGFIQEILQLITFKHHFFTSNEIGDLGVDLVTAGMVFIVWKVAARRKEPYETQGSGNYNQ